MESLKKLIVSLHNLLKDNEKINRVYDTNEELISSEIIRSNDLNKDQLKNNFYGTITYLYNNYCAKTNNPGGYTSDIIYTIYDIFKLLNKNIKLLDQIDVFLLLKTYILLMFFSVTVQKEGDITSLLNKDLKIDKCFKNRKVLFRGEDNFDFNLIPSFYRKGLTKFEDDITVIDDNYLKGAYIKNGMLQLYREIFGSKYGYGFLAFMQHTFAYSPFLDFTRSHVIALAFAATKISEGKDGSIYVLDTKNDVSKNRIKDKRKVIYSKRRLNIHDKMGDKSLYNCSFLDFEPMIRLYKNQPNDRMKYQKGIFMDIYRCIIVNGILLLPVGSEKLVKYRIPSAKLEFNKKKIAYIIRKSYPQYKYRLLMNPYLYFEKWSNKK